MNVSMSINGTTATFEIFSGHGHSINSVIGSSFPAQALPGGVVNRIMERIPPRGEHAMLFELEYISENFGRTRRLVVVVFWYEQPGVLVGKSVDEMKAHEWAKFNTFNTTGTTLCVRDPKRNVRYVSTPLDVVEDDFTYYVVGIKPLLKYITRQISLEDLGAAAIQEQIARNLLAEKEAELDRLNRQYRTLLADHTEKQQSLEEALYRFVLWVRYCYRHSWLIRLGFSLSNTDETLDDIIVLLPANSVYNDKCREQIAGKLTSAVMLHLK